MPTSRSSHFRGPGPIPGLLAVALLVLPAAAQRGLRAPIAVQPSLKPAQPPADDPGRAPRLLESANVDRFLRRAQQAIAREDFPSAIRILQEVIEGRTLEEAPAESPAQPTGPGDAPPAAASSHPDSNSRPNPNSNPAPAPTAAATVEDPEHAVFSTDGRLYRPVRGLCQELLAALPAEAVTYYRTLFEVPAEKALAEARAHHDVAAVEQVFETWFVTRAAASAMELAGDMRMDDGSYRAAIRDYALLLQVYPDAGRTEAGIDATWLRFKTALCLQLLGDAYSARAELDALAKSAPDATLRIGGELYAAHDLGKAPWFANAGAGSPRRRPADDAGVGALRSPHETLVPIWEQRFVDTDPYRPAKGSDERRLVIGLGGTDQGVAATPRPAQFAPGTSAWLGGDRIAFLDHFRMRLDSLTTGEALAATDGPVEQPTPRPGVPRVRIAAYDTVAQRVIADDERFYAVIGAGRTQLSGMKPVLSNQLEAYRRGSLERVWTTSGQSAFADVTFLAAPTVAGDRLLVPTQLSNTFGVDCIHSATGALLFRVPLNGDGTDLARPVAPPVAVDSGIAYVLTGAGVLGAIDVHTGSLRWIRRYERVHPLRPRPKVRARPGMGGRCSARRCSRSGTSPASRRATSSSATASWCSRRATATC